MTNPADIRRYCRAFSLRHFFLQRNTSGLYLKKGLQDCAKEYKINYTTLRMELKTYAAMGIFTIAGKKIKINKLTGYQLKHWKRWLRERDQFGEAPEEYFTNSHICRQLSFFKRFQARREAAKYDLRNGKKLLSKVAKKFTKVGPIDGIFITERNFGKFLGVDGSTAWRYLKRLETDGWIKIHRVNKEVGTVSQIKHFQETIAGKFFIKEGKVYLRCVSDYEFC
jgi:hypothetical protein